MKPIRKAVFPVAGLGTRVIQMDQEALMTSAWIAGPAALAVFGALMLRRMAVENSALAEASRPIMSG